MAWHMQLLGFALKFCFALSSCMVHGPSASSLHLTGFCPDHENNQASRFLSKSCHYACLLVGALELEMGKALVFCIHEGCFGPMLLSSARSLQVTSQVTSLGTLQVTLQFLSRSRKQTSWHVSVKIMQANKLYSLQYFRLQKAVEALLGVPTLEHALLAYLSLGAGAIFESGSMTSSVHKSARKFWLSVLSSSLTNWVPQCSLLNQGLRLMERSSRLEIELFQMMVRRWSQWAGIKRILVSSITAFILVPPCEALIRVLLRVDLNPHPCTQIITWYQQSPMCALHLTLPSA